MALTGEERRALRAIEEALTADDPRLAALLRGRRPGRYLRLLRRATRVLVALAVLMLVLGIVAADPGLQSTAVLMLLCVPPLSWALRHAVNQDG